MGSNPIPGAYILDTTLSRHLLIFRNFPPIWKKLSDIYDYPQRIQRYKRSIATFGENGELALRFLDHITSQGLSQARISKIASHIPMLLRLIDFKLADANRAEVERLAASIMRTEVARIEKAG
ncbi:MAG: hypothetical protein QXU99_08255 [Candidatus Bathyarchaeia archaeon]